MVTTRQGSKNKCSFLNFTFALSLLKFGSKQILLVALKNIYLYLQT